MALSNNDLLKRYKLLRKVFTTLGIIFFLDAIVLKAAGIPSIGALFLYPLLNLFFNQNITFSILGLYTISHLFFFLSAIAVQGKINGLIKMLPVNKFAFNDEFQKIHKDPSVNKKQEGLVNTLDKHKLSRNQLYTAITIIGVALIICGFLMSHTIDSFFIKRSVETGFSALIVGNCETAIRYGFNAETCNKDKEIFQSIIEVEVIKAEFVDNVAKVQLLIHLIDDGSEKEAVYSQTMMKESFSKWIFVKPEESL